MDDKIQSALEEAEQLMSELGGGGDDDDDNNNGEIAFSIDSDEEGEEVELNGPPPPKKAGITAVPHPLLPNDDNDDHPLKPTSSSNAPSSTNSSSVSVNNDFHPLLLSSAPGLGQPGPSPNHSNATNAQQQSNFSMAGSMEQQTTTGAALLGDALKQQTSRFASGLVNMAQRAAHQVASATTQQAHPPQQLSFQGSSSFGSHSAVITNSSAQSQQQQRLPPEMDNEQKAALIRAHVGPLLPGERVIMFLAHLAHVSDSTGFSYTYSPTLSSSSSSSGVIWCCAMTYYRLILFGTAPLDPPDRPKDWNPACWPTRPVQVLQLPLASMERVERSVFAAPTMTNAGPGGGAPNAGGGVMSLMGLHCQGKDNGRFIRFTTPSYADTVRAHEALQTYAFPGKRNLGYLFAFESKKDAVMKSITTDPTTGIKQVTLPSVKARFSAPVEFERQFSKFTRQPCPWVLYPTMNAQYQLCASYPSILAGPALLNESSPDSVRVLQQSAAFRSEQRLPVLTYAHNGTGGASIWRASQPKIGLQGNRSSADEWLLKQVLEQAVQANNNCPNRPIVPPRQVLMQLTGSASLEQLASHWWPSAISALAGNCELKILDLRPRSSAMANRTGGYGYENTSNYVGTTIQFCNIGNIHAVRDAYQKMSSACMSLQQNELQWNSTLEDTKWLSSVRLILSASWETAYWVHIFQLPVLLHCSHGWDRTSQVAAVAQLILDPYYRTMAGFACLVEKDFMAFGHPFHTRCAHGVGGGSASSNGGAPGAPLANVANAANADFDEGQVSPIFLQFLDCVYQLVALYPEAFEFNTRYLLDLSDHVYSCRFGNFLCDTERERETVAGIRQRTHSVWDFLEARHVGTSSEQDVLNSGVLLMPLPTLLRNVTLWSDRHAKFGPKPTQRWWPTTSSTSAVSNSEGRHDEDAPNWYRVPTLQEASQLLYSSVSATSSSAYGESEKDLEIDSPQQTTPSQPQEN